MHSAAFRQMHTDFLVSTFCTGTVGWQRPLRLRQVYRHLLLGAGAVVAGSSSDTSGGMLLDEDVDSMGLVAPCGDDGRRFSA